MSYRLKIAGDRPSGLWLLDGTLSDYSGLSAAAVSIGGTTEYHAALVAGVQKASIVTNAKKVKVPSRFFKTGWEKNSFSLEAWIFNPTANTEILSHTGLADGLSVVNGEVRFTVKLSTGIKSIAYKPDTIKGMHVVGVYTPQNISLYVNGHLHQKMNLEGAGTFVASTDTGFLYAGTGGSVAVNALAIYEYPLTSNQVQIHYQTGRATVNPNSVPQMYGGQNIDITDKYANVALTEVFGPKMSWTLGAMDTLYIDNTGSLSQQYVDEVYLAGTWTYAFDASYYEGEVHSVKLAWEGMEVFSVDTSPDGVVWSPAANNNLVSITPGELDNLFIRVTFPENANAHLDLLEIVSFYSPDLNVPNREVIATLPCYRDEMSPIEFRTDQGLKLLAAGGIEIHPSTAGDSTGDKTWEFWYYSDTAGIDVEPTTNWYEDGVAATATAKAGQWHLIHISSSTAIPQINIDGNTIIGRIAVYPTQLTSIQIAEIYKQYTGKVPVPIPSANSITIGSPEVKIYSSDWTVSGA